MMIQDEITVIDGASVSFNLEYQPFLSSEFDIINYKNYKMLEDYNKKNFFDIENYIGRKGKA